MGTHHDSPVDGDPFSPLVSPLKMANLVQFWGLPFQGILRIPILLLWQEVVGWKRKCLGCDGGLLYIIIHGWEDWICLCSHYAICGFSSAKTGVLLQSPNDVLTDSGPCRLESTHRIHHWHVTVVLMSWARLSSESAQLMGLYSYLLGWSSQSLLS